MKPIIGIVSRVLSSENYLCCIEKVREAVIKIGAIPILILPLQENDPKDKDSSCYTEKMKQDLISVLDLCDAFILPGGESWYELDELVIYYALKRDKPLLGICLGMQALGKVLSGEVRVGFDNTIKNATSIDHCQVTKKYVHSIKINKESMLFDILGKEEIMVNSRHNYHIPAISSCYIGALSEDGLIEEIEDRSKNFIVGVQWHPETYLDDDESAKLLFEAFLAAIFKSSQKFHKKTS